MTEFGLDGMIESANLIHNSLVYEMVSGYNPWSLVWPDGGGLVVMEGVPWDRNTWINEKGYHINPCYWSMKHYSYFIEPGFKRVNASSGNSNVLVSAFLSPDYDRLVAVFINRSTTESMNVTLNPGSFVYDASNIYQTAGNDHFVSLGPVIGSQLALPVSSLTTVVFDHYGPVAPMGLSATMITNNQVNLTWTAAPSAASFNVKRSTSSGGPYTTIATGVTTTSFSDTNVIPGVTYYYVVSAISSEGESANSNEATPFGLHVYLRLDETNGTTASDATGNG